ncbi:MAG: hypothetical protein JWP97_3832 [Labilithrix sp.]|nr:hypothetical protein [Labilithrix sp.]
MRSSYPLSLRASLVAPMTLLALTCGLAPAACSDGARAVTEGADAATGGSSGAVDHEDAGGAGSDASTAGDARADAASPESLEDPAKAGPFATATTVVTFSAKTGDALTLHVVAPVPSGSAAGPFPVVLIAPGYTIAASQYEGYAIRLATHGIVGITVSMPQDSKNQRKDAQDLQATLDWAQAPGGSLASVLDATRAGVMGHSRGGKAAVLAAVADARFRAVLGLDPVDSRPPFSTCDPVTECPDASDAVATVTVPTGFLGETLDGVGAFQACAPVADNFQTFHAKAPSPSFAVTIAGASHMSFIGDLASCGLTCSVCKTATRAQAEVTALAYAYTAAFFRRHLRGEAGYDAYLTGAEAKARYVTPGVATIDAK